jgi:DNA-binding transcriptional regulator LsrR (DeoR family)
MFWGIDEMKKIVDDDRLIYKVCCLYYEDGMNQKEIGDYLGVSRSSVLRMLQNGRDRGIVTIVLHNPASFNYGELEKKLEVKYGLKDVVIVEESVLDSKSEAATYIFGQAADYLYSLLREGYRIGVTMGHTLDNVLQTNKTFKKFDNILCVPIVGGISQGATEGMDVQGNEMARKFTEKFGGKYIQFLSPAMFSDKRILDTFLQEKAVNFIFEEFKKINVAVVGIGVPKGEDHTLIKAGYATAKELKELAARGAVGDITLQFFDEKGNTEPFHEFNDRVAAIPMDVFRKIPLRIGIASGEKKAEAVKGAIKGKLINILITNAECARKLLAED